MNDKKGKMLGTNIIKINDYFTLNDIALVNKLMYNLLSISQLIDVEMIAASHSLVNIVMTEQPGQLLHMDIVGPSQIRSMGDKWYVLIIVDDYSRYF
jgi:hypothetical protein